jgi:hypothetical protein
MGYAYAVVLAVVGRDQIACSDIAVAEIMLFSRFESHLSIPSWVQEAEADLVVGRGREEVARDVEQAL